MGKEKMSSTVPDSAPAGSVSAESVPVSVVDSECTCKEFIGSFDAFYALVAGPGKAPRLIGPDTHAKLDGHMRSCGACFRHYCILLVAAGKIPPPEIVELARRALSARPTG